MSGELGLSGALGDVRGCRGFRGALGLTEGRYSGASRGIGGIRA